MPFPSNPVDRQVATVNNTSYIYSNVKTAWQVNQLTGSAIADTVSYDNFTVETNIILPSNTNKPNTNVATGTLHFDSTYGNLEIYYSNTWVNIGTFDVPNTAVVTSNATLTTSGSYTIAAFNASGSVIFPVAKTVDILVVAGGGGGAGGDGSRPGGGAGGVIYATNYSMTAGTYTITIGGGGAGGTTFGNTGTDTTFGSMFTSKGGGGGGYSGGSGGGSSAGYGGGYSATQPSQSGLSGAYGWGNPGSNDYPSGPFGNGGGGAGAAGSGRYGGNGLLTIFTDFGTDINNDSGVATKGYFAGGGAAAWDQNTYGGSFTQVGGAGGGGYGQGRSGYSASSGLTNMGGGGGGSKSTTGSSGGSGVVLLRWTT